MPNSTGHAGQHAAGRAGSPDSPAEPLVLGIESSCDETAAAVVRGLHVHSSVVASQIEIHAEFGGVVPELASRHHLLAVGTCIKQALAKAEVRAEELDAIAVTDGPGLVGALLVGVQAGRGLGLALDRPVYGIHHMEGHVVSAFLGDPQKGPPAPFHPHLALLVSGGHTELVHVRGIGDYEIVGMTRDDAVGEAYDKVAKRLGLGYPGGPIVDRLAKEGRADAVHFPRAMMDKGLDFSFSGLKTAVMVHLEREGEPQSREHLADLCASFQAAVVDVLVAKTRKARAKLDLRAVHIVGGVAANAGLRHAMQAAAEAEGFAFVASPLRYCGDNAAMIAGAAAMRIGAGARPSTNVDSSIDIDDARLRL